MEPVAVKKKLKINDLEQAWCIEKEKIIYNVILNIFLVMSV